jgi:hypothetical protein
MVCPFVFQRPEEAFHDRVVVTASRSTHGTSDSKRAVAHLDALGLGDGLLAVFVVAGKLVHGQPEVLHLQDQGSLPPRATRTVPVLSRIQNIGCEADENGRTAEWCRANHKTPCRAAMVEDGEFSCPTPIVL